MTTDRELMQQALDLLNDINQCSLPPIGIPLPAEIDHVMEALRDRLAQPEQEELGEVIPADEDQLKRIAKLVEQEPVATLFGSLPVYDVPPAKPVAWVENLENARPHCVTDLKYCSVAQHERGEHLKYIPLYTVPPQREWQVLTENEIKHLWYEACQTNLELTSQLIVHLARNIEAKLKEKNT